MPDAPPAHTGGDLRRFRLSRGWTLADLAVWAGYHRGTLSRIERTVGISKGHLSRLERGLSPMTGPISFIISRLEASLNRRTNNKLRRHVP